MLGLAGIFHRLAWCDLIWHGDERSALYAVGSQVSPGAVCDAICHGGERSALYAAGSRVSPTAEVAMSTLPFSASTCSAPFRFR